MRFGRLVAAVVLLATLVAMTVHYGAVADSHDPYPTAEALDGDYERYVGEEFFGWMDVVAVEDGTLVVTNTVDGALVLRVSPAPPGVQPGDVVQVYGVLAPDNRVEARRVVVSGQRDRQSMFLVSAAAVPVVLGLFAREWTVDWERRAVVPRGKDG